VGSGGPSSALQAAVRRGSRLSACRPRRSDSFGRRRPVPEPVGSWNESRSGLRARLAGRYGVFVPGDYKEGAGAANCWLLCGSGRRASRASWARAPSSSERRSSLWSSRSAWEPLLSRRDDSVVVRETLRLGRRLRARSRPGKRRPSLARGPVASRRKRAQAVGCRPDPR